MTRRTGRDRSDRPAPNLLDGSWTLRLFLQHWGIAPWKLALLGWSAYYVVPMVTTMICGAFLSPDFVEDSHLKLVLPWLPVVRWLSRADVTELPYVKDITHFAMASIAILLGGSLVLRAVVRFQSVFDFLLNSKQIQAPRSALDAELKKLRRRCKNWIVRCVILGMAILLSGAMYSKTRAHGLEYWWGHSSHGPAGIFFAVACGLALYFGGVCLWLLTTGLNSISTVFEHPISLRPFHPDGCNGLKPVGNYIIFLFCLCLAMAVAIWITLGLGYLHIQDLLATWIVALGAILVVPLILIKPLVRITGQVRTARFEKLSAIDQRLQGLLADFEKHLSDSADAIVWRKSLSDLLEARHAMNDIYSTNIFPFSPRVAGTLSVSYIFQAALFVHQVLEKLNLYR